jgi:hypothetical protein
VTNTTATTPATKVDLIGIMIDTRRNFGANEASGRKRRKSIGPEYERRSAVAAGGGRGMETESDIGATGKGERGAVVRKKRSK